MKLVTFEHAGSVRIGAVVGEEVVDFSAAPDLPTEMVAFLETGDAGLERARAVVAEAKHVIPLAAVALKAPILRPGKFLVHGANYRSTRPPLPADSEVAIAANRAGNRAIGSVVPEMRAGGHQLWANKQPASVNGPYDDVVVPAISPELIYETELAIVIGRTARNVSVAEAESYIAGYTICNDLTVVDWSQHSPTVTLGKSFPTHGPIGPWIVTRDEIADPQALELRASVNGELGVTGNTASMIRNCVEQVAYLSQVFPLEPGDILSTGTDGVPVEFLRPGDVIRCEIEGIGYIENTVVTDTTR